MIQGVAIPVAGARLFRANIGAVLSFVALLVALDIVVELFEFATTTTSSVVSLVIWAMLLGRFHETALGRSDELNGTSGTRWSFLWRYTVLIIVFVIVPLMIGAIIFLGLAKNAAADIWALRALTGFALIVGLPLALVSVLGFAHFGTVFPANVDLGKATFRDALRYSKGRRFWIFVRILTWWLGPNVLVILIGVAVSSLFSSELLVNPETSVPNVPAILLALFNNCLSAYGTACGAAIFSRVYLEKRDAVEAPVNPA